MKQQKETVLVTGGSGFLANYCILQLLAEGYAVKTTIRRLDKKMAVINQLQAGGLQHPDRLYFIAADLTKDENWHEAVAGCTYILHVASPFPGNASKNENELIMPAKDGTLRVLCAAHSAGVKRVVLTSSFAAVGYSINPRGHVFTEADWTDANAKLPAYIKSKAVAEKAAWDFVTGTDGKMELTVINPVGIFGPVLGEDFSSSIHIIRRMMTGEMPAIPDVYTNLADVRDVADLHIRAMLASEAAGQRFLALSGPVMSFTEIAHTIKTSVAEVSERVSIKAAPSWLLRVLSLLKPELKQVIPNLGVVRNAANGKAKRILGWKPRSNQEIIIDTAKSLLERGIVKV
ncbi:aldehyde reductase [Mucilaginibacter sp. OK283]|jgi:dihydroflavonol-4-reductase|uniref:SDR family oxidoreductase n=1 Tax=Mucilaginibacter sp. OK283 TaxID=1881049 RepID=UPI0008CE6587|nr:aldehyde reductase [Mucilaginibacter sp. OK283]SEP38279.1 dihydroflavonol-4-reductase [Mucilaginibacter sp. OK283]